MRLIVADTSPIFYLLSIGHIDLLPQLFEKYLYPTPYTRNQAIRQRPS
jgi:predicted nucleic acid-binding protein